MGLRNLQNASTLDQGTVLNCTVPENSGMTWENAGRLEQGHIVNGLVFLGDQGSRDVIEPAIQAGFELRSVPQSPHQNIPPVPVHRCQLRLHVGRKHGLLKGDCGKNRGFCFQGD